MTCFIAALRARLLKERLRMVDCMYWEGVQEPEYVLMYMGHEAAAFMCVHGVGRRWYNG